MHVYYDVFLKKEVRMGEWGEWFLHGMSTFVLMGCWQATYPLALPQEVPEASCLPWDATRAERWRCLEVEFGLTCGWVSEQHATLALNIDLRREEEPGQLLQSARLLANSHNYMAGGGLGRGTGDGTEYLFCYDESWSQMTRWTNLFCC